jgi:hypothetical protein
MDDWVVPLGLRALTPAWSAARFLEEYLRPLFFWRTTDEGQEHKLREFQSAAEFWFEGDGIVLCEVRAAYQGSGQRSGPRTGNHRVVS